MGKKEEDYINKLPESDFSHYKRKSKRGVKALIFDPELLWLEACVYFEQCDSRGWYETKHVGRTGREVKVKHPVPYTLQGLSLFLGVNVDYFYQFKDTEEYKEQKEHFDRVFARIKNTVDTQQLEGAMTGFFNPNIVARLAGLVDKKDITTGGQALSPQVVVSSPEIADAISELKKL